MKSICRSSTPPRFVVQALTGLLTILVCTLSLQAQQSESPIRMFGYFQTNYTQYTHEEEGFNDAKSFSMQQMNLFLQKDLDRDLTTFVNFEFLNNYSSGRQWGSFAIEEAWIRYHAAPGFNIRLGLQTPTFNYLNDIKNRTPLMPYVIRPLIYESSFNEILRLEEYVPARAYVQAFGYIPKGIVKLDYALYAGDSPNINSDKSNGQTGVDTTMSVLFGGRIGLRAKELNLGVSATWDKFNFPSDVRGAFQDEDVSTSLPRTRLGGDVRYAIGSFALESEFIRVNYQNELGGFDVDLRFYYGTIFCDLTDRIRVYGSYWVAKERYFRQEEIEGVLGGIDTITVNVNYKLTSPTFGAAYTLSDKMVIKVQVAPVTQEFRFSDSETDFRLNYFAAALSVFL